jgi:hypothetical protein
MWSEGLWIARAKGLVDGVQSVASKALSCGIVKAIAVRRGIVGPVAVVNVELEF